MKPAISVRLLPAAPALHLAVKKQIAILDKEHCEGERKKADWEHIREPLSHLLFKVLLNRPSDVLLQTGKWQTARMHLYHSEKWQEIYSWNGNLQCMELIHYTRAVCQECTCSYYPFISCKCNQQGQHCFSAGAAISVNKTQAGVLRLNPGVNYQHAISFNEPCVHFHLLKMEQRCRANTQQQQEHNNTDFGLHVFIPDRVTDDSKQIRACLRKKVEGISLISGV